MTEVVVGVDVGTTLIKGGGIRSARPGGGPGAGCDCLRNSAAGLGRGGDGGTVAAGGGLPARARRPARRRPCGTGHGHRRVHGRGVAGRSGRPPGTQRNRVARCASSERAGRTTYGRASRTQLRRLLQRAHARVRAGGAALAAGPRTVRAGTGTYPAVRQGLDPLPAHRRGGHRRQRRQSRAGRCSASHVLAAVDGRLGGSAG